MHRSVVILFALALAGCLAGTSPSPESTDESPIASGEPVRFVVLGDMGTGEEDQLAVAASMQQVCQERGCDFVVGVGDNIYEVGVVSSLDPQFELKFEQPYAAFDIPFYMALGNHDNGGTRGVHAGGDLQVDYHYRTDKASDKWQMPGRWYSHEHGDVLFMAIDTNVIWSSNAEVPAAAPLLSSDVDAVRQTAFIEETLAASNASWTFVHGHHPLFSNGDHGDEPGPTGAWLFETICGRGAFDVTFSGHDHDLQWIEAKPDLCGNTEFVVSGAGAKTRSIVRDTHTSWFEQGDTLGFFWAEVQGDTFTGAFYTLAAQQLYERSFTR